MILGRVRQENEVEQWHEIRRDLYITLRDCSVETQDTKE